ncbi:Protein of Unknown function [Marinobacter daqiaonensis]|uniref:DUF2784 domain-containing protein n=1 Tax=Marinobacter daqiaonensis TaxID=650891 RepID=A0A1I6JAV1_9GAMM|nr:DUF2784 domain-containing protein [Marinobacter daqiaonensis]SFR76066.1 Protein of Unknown function [Marinobacter daqiaonensis]
MPWQLLADAVLTVHLGVVIFVVFGLGVILVGNLRHWRWVNHLWFRLLHLAAIGVVVAQAWLGVICPLTTLEMWLRGRAGKAGYEGGFIQHWMQELLYYEAPPWVFIVLYTGFGLLVLASWWWFPPRRRH